MVGNLRKAKNFVYLNTQCSWSLNYSINSGFLISDKDSLKHTYVHLYVGSSQLFSFVGLGIFVLTVPKRSYYWALPSETSFTMMALPRKKATPRLSNGLSRHCAPSKWFDSRDCRLSLFRGRRPVRVSAEQLSAWCRGLSAKLTECKQTTVLHNGRSLYMKHPIVFSCQA